MSSLERFFPNPYSDYHRREEPSVVELSPGQRQFDDQFWSRWVKETGLLCTKKQKAKAKYCDGTLYTGNLGLGFMVYKMLDSGRYADIDDELKTHMRECVKVNLEFYNQYGTRRSVRDLAYLVGRSGIYVMACLSAKVADQNQEEMNRFAQEYAALAPLCVPVNFLPTGGDEMFVGRAGYLCGLLFLQKYLNIQPVPFETISNICESIVQSGRQYSIKSGSPSPLMFAYHGTEYLGVGHGLAGILLVLLCFPDYLRLHPEAENYVKESIDFILTTRKPNGNFPPAMNPSNNKVPDRDTKDLLHWCHGAAGIFHLMLKAYTYFCDKKYLYVCEECSDIIWQRGLLRKGPGICHGIAGNGYVHLMMYRLTKDAKYLHRAVCFAQFLMTQEFQTQARTPDNPFSLFEGLAGTVCFVADLLEPEKAQFPLMPVF